MTGKPEISVAPMMDWTDRHCRYFHRLLAPHIKLYTEMVTTGALIHGDRERFLRYRAEEHPVTLQIGGNDPDALAECAKMGEDAGYDEINLNCGCPSDRVQNGNFGACLMAESALVGKCVEKMIEAVDIPVTVKCRIAIDEYEEQPFLERFLSDVSATGCKNFIIHARKAWLSGLSPKENREIPPLNYDLVEKMKVKYPQLRMILNGGIRTLDSVQDLLPKFEGLMIGREAYQNPWFLTEIEQEIFGNKNIPSREDIAHQMIPYIEQQGRDYSTPVKTVTRHMIGLFQGQPGAKHWRRTLSEATGQESATELIEMALPK